MKREDLIGKRVLNVHRQSCDLPREYRGAHKGTVLDVEQGCNGLVKVQFDGREFPAWMVKADLAFCDKWPGEGCRVTWEES